MSCRALIAPGRSDRDDCRRPHWETSSEHARDSVRDYVGRTDCQDLCRSERTNPCCDDDTCCRGPFCYREMPYHFIGCATRGGIIKLVKYASGEGRHSQIVSGCGEETN